MMACNFITKMLQHRCFPMKFPKILRKPILKNISERLLLKKYREIACETACYVSPKTCSQTVQIFRLATKKSKTYLGLCQTLVMELFCKKQLINFAKRYLPKQSSICVLMKGCSENFQQIYRRTPKPKCDKVSLHRYSPVNLLRISGTSFYKNTY